METDIVDQVKKLEDSITTKYKGINIDEIPLWILRQRLEWEQIKSDPNHPHF